MVLMDAVARSDACLDGSAISVTSSLCKKNPHAFQGPLIELAPLLGPRVKAGGSVALSGILTSQAAAVCKAYKPHFGNFQILSDLDGDWALIVGKRKQSTDSCA